MTKNELNISLAQLQEKYEALIPSLELDKKQRQLATLNQDMQKPGFWDDQKKAQKVSQEAAQLENIIVLWQTLAESISDLTQLTEIAEESELSDIETEVVELEKEFNKAETLLLLSGPYDQRSAILSLHVGNGGQDAEDFTQMLLRMYFRFAERKGYRTNLLNESTTEDGLKSATIEITGPTAYGYLKGEHGVHRLIRLSPFNAKNLRQTSFAKVEVLPEIENESELTIDPNDLRVDVFRASGHGGQSVNTTDSAVRITYLPLDLVVTCQNEKSQLQNKNAAMKVLLSRLAKIKEEQQAQKLEEIRGELLDANFGSQIRTYTLHPYKQVKDHRTNYEENNPDRVLDGEIDGFIETSLKNKS